MREQKQFKNVRHNHLHLLFPNGNWISTTWGYGTYSDNYNLPHDYTKGDEMQKLWETFRESDTVEIMIDCPEKLKKRIHKKYDGDGSVIGRLNLIQWVEILGLLKGKS